VKLIQLNIWQGRLIKQAVRFLLREQPDIICLQELSSSAIGDAGFLETNSLEQLKTALSVEYAAFAPRWNYDLMGVRAGYGNGILSRLPIIGEETRFLHGVLNENFVFGRDYRFMTNAQRVKLSVAGKELEVFNHHGYYLPDPNGNETSKAGLENLAAWAGEYASPTILTGDLNVWPQSPALQMLNSHFRNLITEHAIDSTLSQLNFADVACDYIFVNDQIKVQHFEVSEELVSDHKALILEFDI